MMRKVRFERPERRRRPTANTTATSATVRISDNGKEDKGKSKMTYKDQEHQYCLDSNS